MIEYVNALSQEGWTSYEKNVGLPGCQACDCDRKVHECVVGLDEYIRIDELLYCCRCAVKKLRGNS